MTVETGRTEVIAQYGKLASDLFVKFEKYADKFLKVIQLDKEPDWFSVGLGFGLAQNMDPMETYLFACYVRQTKK